MQVCSVANLREKQMDENLLQGVPSLCVKYALKTSIAAA